MKRIYYLICIQVFLIACAGNPPAWWNPRNLQPGQEATAKQRVSSQAAKSAASEETPSELVEESIEVSNDEYEEMQLTPLQDEEQENATGETSAQVTDDSEMLIPSVLAE